MPPQQPGDSGCVEEVERHFPECGQVARRRATHFLRDHRSKAQDANDLPGTVVLVRPQSPEDQLSGNPGPQHDLVSA